MTDSWDIKKVLVSDEVDDQCIEILKSNGIEAIKQTKLTKDELKTEITKYDGLIVRSATKVTADVIEAGTRLKVIGRAGTGVDNIDVTAATRRGILVMNTPGGNTLSAAEHTCAMLMAVTRHVSQGTACIRAGQWDRKKFMIGNELYGKTLAIIGLGRIGREVAHRMQSFGMRTVGFDPMVSAEESSKYGIEWLSLNEIWPLADYITLHTPLIPQTKNLINLETLAKCRKGVRVVNCARGGIIDEDDLLEALKSGHCAGAGLDVFEQEPPTNSALLQHPLLTSTPHLGASTVEAQSRVAVEVAQNIVELATGSALNGAINGDALALSLNLTTRHWPLLATALAKLARTLLGGTSKAISSVNLITRGNLLKSAGNSMVSASLIGLVNSDYPLNLISAPASAKSAGIEVKTSHNNDDGLTTVTLTVTVPPEASGIDGQLQPLNSVTLVGTVVNGHPLWIAVNENKFAHPVVLSGSQLIYRSIKTSKTTACLSILNDFLNGLEADVLLFTSTLVTPGSDVIWGSIQLSQVLKQVPSPSNSSTFVQITF